VNRATPIIHRPGGKGRMLKHLLPIIDGTPHKVYVEPFCGGAAVLLAKRPSRHEVINDTDCEVINLYRQARHHLQELMRELRFTVDSRRLFSGMAPHPHMTEIQRAAAYLYRNTYSFTGNVRNYGMMRTGSRSVFSLMRRLAHFRARLDRVTVENLDWERCMALYDCPGALHFCDPPYTSVKQLDAYHPWTRADAHRLRDRLATLKGKWIVTLDDCPGNRDLFSGCGIIPVSTRANMTAKSDSSRRFKEMIITPP